MKNRNNKEILGSDVDSSSNGSIRYGYNGVGKFMEFRTDSEWWYDAWEVMNDYTAYDSTTYGIWLQEVEVKGVVADGNTLRFNGDLVMGYKEWCEHIPNLKGNVPMYYDVMQSSDRDKRYDIRLISTGKIALQVTDLRSSRPYKGLLFENAQELTDYLNTELGVDSWLISTEDEPRVY